MSSTVKAPQTPAEIRAKAEAWYASQLATLQACHGRRWPEHRPWLEEYLKAELKQRLLALGWRPRR